MQIRPLLVLGLVGWLLGPFPQRFPTMVPYEPPSFDTATVASAVLRIDGEDGPAAGRGGTAVLIRRDGLAMTAYHNVGECVAKLRQEEATRHLFGEDGSYSGAGGALPCADFRARFLRPSSNERRTWEAPDPVYLVAVPPAHEATPPLPVYLDRVPAADERVAKRDYALLCVAPHGRVPLALSTGSPKTGDKVWLVGLGAETGEPADSATVTLARSIAHLDLESRLARVLAEGAMSQERGARMAREVLESVTIPAEGHDERSASALRDLRRVVEGEGDRVASERLAERAALIDSYVKELRLSEQEVVRVTGVVGALREYAQRPHGARVADALRITSELLFELRVDQQWALNGDIVRIDDDGARWHGVIAFSGRVVSSDQGIVLDSFATAGMSGGPVLNARGEVVGVLTSVQGGGSVFRPSSVFAARPTGIESALVPSCSTLLVVGGSS